MKRSVNGAAEPPSLEALSGWRYVQELPLPPGRTARLYDFVLPVAVFDGARQVFSDKPDPFRRDAVGERVIERAAVRFQTMRPRIHAGSGGDHRRHADRERGIADDDLRHHAGMKNDLLRMRAFVGDNARSPDL